MTTWLSAASRKAEGLGWQTLPWPAVPSERVIVSGFPLL